MKLYVLLSATAAFALAACGSASDEAAATDEATDAVVETPAEASAVMPQTFVDTMAASDMYEIEAAKLAQQMGKSQKVKDFAAMMVRDHTDSSAKLTTAAAAVVPPLTVAPALTAAQQTMLDALRGAGDGFDSMYAQQQVSAHEEALAGLRDQADNGAVPQLKDFAAATATVVEKHLETARSLP